MVAAPHKPRRCLLRFLLPSRLAPLDEYCGPTGTVLPPSVPHRPAVQHVQPTTYRIPVELAGGKNTLLRSPVEHPSRRIRQHSHWSSLQPRGSWSHGTRCIHADPRSRGRSYDRPVWTSLRTRPRKGPDHGRTLSNYTGRAGPSATRSHLCPFPAWNHLCPSSARNHLRPPSTRSHIRTSSAWSHLRPLPARRRLRPLSWGLGTHYIPHQRPVPVW